MRRSTSSIAGCTGLLVVALATTGCTGFPVGSSTPFYGALGIPIPVSPYYQDEEEDRFWIHERYARVPILGPITAGGPAVALDPPSPDEVMQALEKARPVEGGWAMLHEVSRNNVRMVVEPIADYIDPCRVYPTIGPAQLHHAHYKCTIYFTETTREGWPLPHTRRDEETIEVVYIDHNHLHMVGDVDGGPSSNY